MTYALVLLVFLDGVLIPHAYFSYPWTHEACTERKVRILSGQTNSVKFVAKCYPIGVKP